MIYDTIFETSFVIHQLYIRGLYRYFLWKTVHRLHRNIKDCFNDDIHNFGHKRYRYRYVSLTLFLVDNFEEKIMKGNINVMN